MPTANLASLLVVTPRVMAVGYWLLVIGYLYENIFSIVLQNLNL